jgi:hypothetical protein
MFASAEAHVETLAALIGRDAAADRVEAWLGRQYELIGERAFAERFHMHFPHFEADVLDYAHRIISTPKGSLLGGIRFYGGNTARPFVEIVAHDAALDAGTLAAAAARSWSAFSPPMMRLLLDPRSRPARARLDQTVHAARVSDMEAPGGGVTLEPVQDPRDALHIVELRHRDLAASEPELAAEVSVADLDDLSACRQTGTLDFIVTQGGRAGVIATLPGEVAFLEGHVVAEEVVATACTGRGLASEAQRVLAYRLSASAPDGLLIGTVHADNHASRISAERAGRPVVLEYVFVPL